MKFNEIIKKKYCLLEAEGAEIPENDNDAANNDLDPAKVEEAGEDMKNQLDTSKRVLQQMIIDLVKVLAEEKFAFKQNHPNYDYPPMINDMIQEIQEAVINPDTNQAFDALDNTIKSYSSKFKTHSTEKEYNDKIE